jgi:hypothetical protein
MEQYWERKLLTPSTCTEPAEVATSSKKRVSQFELHWQLLAAQGSSEEGWVAELQRYLAVLNDDVTKDTDVVAWWLVRAHPFNLFFLLNVFTEEPVCLSHPCLHCP